jgi:hypothetical protein
MNLDKRKFLEHLRGHAIEGKLEAFSEQGSEGTHWAIYDNQKEKGDGYHRLHMVDQGDRLLVFKGNRIYWEGTVKWQKLTHPAQTYLARYGTVHGLQEGMHPEKWAKMFFDGMDAMLVKDPKNVG